LLIAANEGHLHQRQPEQVEQSAAEAQQLGLVGTAEEEDQTLFAGQRILREVGFLEDRFELGQGIFVDQSMN
jgi:hypothetical protein